MFDEINEIQIVIVDKQGQSMETRGLANTPNVEERVFQSTVESETSVNTMRMIRPIMPKLNEISGGMASQLSGQIEFAQRMGRRYKVGGVAGGALVVGAWVMIASEVAKLVGNYLEKERAKSAEINAASLLKIRTGEMQMGAGIYKASTNFVGKIKYGNN